MTTERFKRLYHGLHSQCGTWRDTYWLGWPIIKCPLDLWLYQEMIHEVRPDLIVECGTACRASALYLANICDLIGNGAVKPQTLTRTRNARSIRAPSTLVEQIKQHISPNGSVMVILNPGPSKNHFLRELHAYGGIVTPGSYLEFEDTILNGHPMVVDHSLGPMEAMREYLKVESYLPH